MKRNPSFTENYACTFDVELDYTTNLDVLAVEEAVGQHVQMVVLRAQLNAVTTTPTIHLSTTQRYVGIEPAQVSQVLVAVVVMSFECLNAGLTDTVLQCKEGSQICFCDFLRNGGYDLRRVVA